MRGVVVVLVILCFGSTLVDAQKAAPSDPRSPSKASDGASPELQDIKPEPSDAKKFTLKDAGPLSPEEAARRTAKGLSERKNTGPKKKTEDKGKAAAGDASGQGKPAADDSVVEFQPAVGGSGTTSRPAATVQDKEAKSPLKRVHGDLYGGTGRADGGSVGATSKGGKTSIYVESDQARGAAPQPR
jgi:hypothetical protein